MLFRTVVAHLAILDCLFALADVAKLPGYTRPTITDSRKFVIEAGRHPMVEAISNETFVPNDISLTDDGLRAMIITGPNMGGKSSYIRMVALVAIMAQIGSFVPADLVELSPFDAIFTRMGARDNIAQGMSTFLVELSEASNILKLATPRSLVILDELGRGTSTHDGMAIAYATMRYLIDQLKCFTLFVTHYPQLGKLQDEYPRQVANFHMAFVAAEPLEAPERSDEEVFDINTSPDQGEAKEESDQHTPSRAQPITFLYKLQPGMCDESYGLNVARLADLPMSVIRTAARRAQAFKEAVEGVEHAIGQVRVDAELLAGARTIESCLNSVAVSCAHEDHVEQLKALQTRIARLVEPLEKQQRQSVNILND